MLDRHISHLLNVLYFSFFQITFYTSEIFVTANLQESIIPYVSLGVSISELIAIIFCVSQSFLGF